MNTSQLSGYILSYRGTPVKALSFVPSSDEGYINVYAQYDSGWQPLHIGLRSIPTLQQVRDMNRNILLNKGSYEDAHFYLRSAEGNNVTTAFYTDADGGAIQSGDTDSYRALNLQPLGGLLTYGGNEVATRNWVNANSTLQAVTNAGNTTTKPIVLNTSIVDVNGTANSGNAIPDGLHVWDTSGYSNATAITTMFTVKKNNNRAFQFGASNTGNFYGRSLHTVSDNSTWRRFWTDGDFTSINKANWDSAYAWINTYGVNVAPHFSYYNSANTDITSLVPGTAFGAWIKSPVNGQVVVTIDGNDDNDSFNILSNNSTLTTSEPMSVNLFRLQRTGLLNANGRFVWNYGNVAGTTPIAQFSQNGGSIQIGNQTSVANQFVGVVRGVQNGNGGWGLGLFGQGADSYSQAAVVLRGSNAGYTGGVAAGNVLVVQNYTTDYFSVAYNGVVKINQLSGTIGYVKADTNGTLSKIASIPYSDISGTPSLSGYELLSNKATSFNTINNTLYPTTQAVADKFYNVSTADNFTFTDGQTIDKYSKIPNNHEGWSNTLSFKTPSIVETTVDNGSTWTPATFTATGYGKLFNNKTTTGNTVGLIPTNTAGCGTRFTFSSGFAYNYNTWLWISPSYTNPAPTMSVLVEQSSDGTTWTTVHTSTKNFSSSTGGEYFLIKEANSSWNYFRITLVSTTDGSLNVASIKMLAVRMSQSYGKESSLPMDWDFNKYLTISSPTTSSPSGYDIALLSASGQITRGNMLSSYVGATYKSFGTLGASSSLLYGTSPAGTTTFHGLYLSHQTNANYGSELALRNNTFYFRSNENGVLQPWLQVADRSWVGSNAVMQGGNSFGASMNIGTNDNAEVHIKTGGTDRVKITTGGNIALNGGSFNNWTSPNNSSILLADSGTLITSNKANSDHALIVNNSNSASTGAIAVFRFNSASKALIDKDGYGMFNRIGVNSTLSTPSYLLDIDGGTSTSTGSIARFTRNGGYVEICNGSSTVGYPVIRGVSSFNSATGLVIGGAGTSDSYSMGAIVLRGYNAAINGGLTGGNVLSVQNYTTELFKIGYDGVATISNLSGTTGYVKAGTSGTLTKVTTIPISDTTYSIPSLQQVAAAGNSFTGDLLLGTTGNEIFVGSAAGTENTRLGKQTLASISGDARWNTAIGSGALHSLTAGYNNTAIGEGAMYDWVSDAATPYSNNTAIGDIAMALATAGVGNVAIGAATGSTGGMLRSRGNYNTFLGTNAGRNAPAGTLGDLNLFIGYNAGAEGLLGSYLLRIGSKAPGATNAPHIIEGTMNPGTETLNLNATVYLRDLPASSGASYLVAWNAATQRLEKDSNTSGYIVNQNASAQSGQFWIGGGAQIGLNPGTGSILSIGDTFTDGFPFVSKALNVTGNVGVAGNVNMNNLSLSDNYGAFTYKLNVGHGDGVHATSYAWIASSGIGGDTMRFAEYGGSFEFYSTAGVAGGGLVARVNPYGIQVTQSYGKYMMSDSSYLYGNDSYWAFYNSANAALPIKAGGLVVSNNYAGTAPANGIFSKGTVLIWGNSDQAVYDNGNTGLVVSGPASTATSMTLGSSVGTKFGVVGETGLYGLFHGVSSVSGEAWIQSGRLDSSTAYNLNLQASGGNVGIGLAAPTYKLDVNGTFRTSSTNVLSGLSGTGTEMVVADSTGTLSRQALPVFPDVSAGTYTPSILSSSGGTFTASEFTYTVISNIVTVTGKVSCSSIVADTNSFVIDLPLSITVSSLDDIKGLVTGRNVFGAKNVGSGNWVQAYFGLDAASVSFVSIDTSAEVYVTFNYTV